MQTHTYVNATIIGNISFAKTKANERAAPLVGWFSVCLVSFEKTRARRLCTCKLPEARQHIPLDEQIYTEYRNKMS
jgi:hypothetical protein